MTRLGTRHDPEHGYQWEESEPWKAIPEIPLVHTFVPALRERPDDSFIEFAEGPVYTNAQVLDLASRMAGFLRAEYPGREPIGVAIGNRVEFFAVWLASLATGNPVVYINPASMPADLTHMLVDSAVRLLIVDDESREAANAAAPDCPQLERIHQLGPDEPDGLDELIAGSAAFDLESDPPTLDDITSITYTSGTTGLPKGCQHRQGELARYTDINLRLNDVSPDDVLLNPLQFFYGDAIWMMCLAIVTGAKFASMRHFTATRFWNVVNDMDVTMIVGIGAIPTILLNMPPSDLERSHSVKLAIQIGIPADDHHTLEERFGFPWYDAYGLSETGANIVMPFDLGEKYVGSGALGIPVPELRTVLLGPDDEILEGPATGELAVDGPYMMAGYLNRPDATAESAFGSYLRTGDLIERDADGIHYFRGRIKEIIRRGGENVAPAEIEAIIRLYPGAAEAAVVPVADPIRGEEIKAYVQSADDPVDFAALAEFIGEHLAPHKVPRYFEHRREPFPRTPSQRIRKSDLEVDGAHTTDEAWDRTGDR